MEKDFYQTMVEDFRGQTDEFVRMERQEAFEFLEDADKFWSANDGFLRFVAQKTIDAANDVLIERDVYGVR